MSTFEQTLSAPRDRAAATPWNNSPRAGSAQPRGPEMVIDARMLFSSGIGRYLREVLARWPAEEAARETYIYNAPAQAEWLAAARPGCRLRPTRAKIYSWREQFLAARLPGEAIYWVPHYNLPWVSRARLVATVHDAAPLVLAEAFPGRAQRVAAHFYFSNVRRVARRVIAVSQFTANELARHAQVDPANITTIPNGVSASWRDLPDRGARRPYQLLYVGNLKAHKNLGPLLDAIETVRRRRGWDVTLEVIGQAAGFRAGLEAATAERLKREPWIRVHGQVDDRRLEELYSEASALVFPSLYEGFGLPLLEAMAAGCPVLASTAGALPEIGGPGQPAGGAVIYFDPRRSADLADRLEYFWQLPPAERARMAACGRTRAGFFSWDTTAARTREILLAEARLVGKVGTSR